jgi:methylglutaconyl-CoA hydratase
MSLVQVRCHEHSGTIVIDRPDKGNALSRALLDDLQQAFFDLHQQRRVRAVIITGSGRAFCSGMDLAEMLQSSRQAEAHAQWREDADRFRELLECMLGFPKPIIAAANGPALAAGAGLLLASDVVLASPEATVGFPEPRRGLVAGVASPLLVFRIGAGPAAQLLLTARTVDADEAHRLGLFHEIVVADLIWARAHEVAAQCARCAPEALALTKRMLNETTGEYLGTLMSAGAAFSASARTTEAAGEGVAAFLEKRDPQWP